MAHLRWNFNHDVLTISNQADEGYVFSVEMQILPEFHGIMRDNPLAAEKLQIHPEMTSEYTKNLAAAYNRKLSLVKKLIPNLFEKNDYVIHYRNLKQCRTKQECS